jgi:hypothetical protein
MPPEHLFIAQNQFAATAGWTPIPLEIGFPSDIGQSDAPS